MHTALQRERLHVSSSRRLLLALACALASTLLTSATASAYTSVGQLFPPANTCAADTFLQTGVGPGINSYTIPVYGAITSWNFWTTAEAVPGLALKVAHPLGEGNYMIVGESVAATAAQHPNEINTFNADILVEPGDVIGLYTSGGATQDCGTVFTEPFDTYVYAEGDWVPFNTVLFQTPSPHGTAPNSLFPVAANISEPPTQALTVPPCSSGSFEDRVTPDIGTAAKAVHYTVDGGLEATAKANGEGIATLKVSTAGFHTVEYWPEDKAGQLGAHQVAAVFVVKIGPKVAITSDQNESAYSVGEKGSISIKASSPYGLTVDPSANHQPIETTQPGFYLVPAVASDNCGNTTKESFQYTVSPFDRKLDFAHEAFVAAKSGLSIARAAGTTVTFTSSGEGVTRFTITKKTAGIEDEGECEKPTRHTRHGKHCTFYESVNGDFARENESGRNVFRFTGRLNGRTLGPGTYRLIATPEFESILGRPVKHSFRILR